MLRIAVDSHSAGRAAQPWRACRLLFLFWSGKSWWCAASSSRAYVAGASLSWAPAVPLLGHPRIAVSLSRALCGLRAPLHVGAGTAPL